MSENGLYTTFINKFTFTAVLMTPMLNALLIDSTTDMTPHSSSSISIWSPPNSSPGTITVFNRFKTGTDHIVQLLAQLMSQHVEPEMVLINGDIRT